MRCSNITYDEPIANQIENWTSLDLIMIIGSACLCIPSLNTKFLPIVFTIEVIKLDDVAQSLLQICLYGVCS